MRLPRIHYAWLVATARFVTLITSAGFRPTAGVLIDGLVSAGLPVRVRARGADLEPQSARACASHRLTQV